MATSKYTVRNSAQGPRGLHTVAGYVELAPGQTLENVEIDDGEHKSAESTGYFEFGAKAKAAAKADAVAAAGNTTGDDLPNNMPKLKGIAKAEGVDLTGTTSVADIKSAIAAHRTAKASDASAQHTDDLDAMSDDDLRNTVQAITAQPAPADADRTALLALARGE